MSVCVCVCWFWRGGFDSTLVLVLYLQVTSIDRYVVSGMDHLRQRVQAVGCLLCL